MLLHSLVQLTLDSAAICIGRQEEPPAGRTQLRQLEPKAGERLVQWLDRRSPQLTDLLVACFWKLSVIPRLASSSPARHVTGWQPPGDSPAGTVVTAAASS
jgi:hypothetical protein